MSMNLNRVGKLKCLLVIPVNSRIYQEVDYSSLKYTINLLSLGKESRNAHFRDTDERVGK